jgi:outer membrane beta-barrel protein
VKISALRFLILLVLATTTSLGADDLTDLEAKVLGDLKDDSESSASSEKSDDRSDKNADEKSAERNEEKPAAKTQTTKESLEEVESLIWGPQSIPNDHILVVQRRFIDKAGDFELTPIHIGFQPSNSFTKQFQWGASLGYHFTESFGIEFLHFAFASNARTELETTIGDATGLQIRHNDNSVLLMASSLLWTPFKSKAATKSNVYHFEGYFLAGGGSILAESSRDPMAMGGLGFRSYLNRDGLFKFEVRDYVQFGGSTVHRVSLLLGAGILL